MTTSLMKDLPPSSVPAQSQMPSVLRTNLLLRLLLGLVLGLAIISLVRIVSGREDLTTAGALGGAVTAAVPILLAGLGGLWSERAGIVNIGLEGQMVLGTWFSVFLAYHTHSAWMLIVGGILGGLIGGALHAIATVGFGVDHIISGVALNIIAPGIAKYLANIQFPDLQGAQSPKVPQLSTLQWHSFGDWLGRVNAHHWFLVSDVAGLVQGLVTSLNWFTIIAILLVPLTWFVLWRTAFGLRLRSVGENPTSAETLGVKVYTMKVSAVLISGALAGLGGAFLVQYAGLYQQNQTGGRGYIGLAAMIFGNWNPGGLLAGAGLFGYTDALQQQTQPPTVHALLLVVAILLGLVGVWLLARRFYFKTATGSVAAVVALVVGALVAIWYATTDSIPDQFATYSPYIITLVVLAVASQRLRMPAADGLPWRRGDAH